MGKNLCVFCGSGTGKSDGAYLDMAKEVGYELARRHWGLVYGGASIGVMGACADACLEKGGKVYGVIPQGIMDLEVGHDGLTELEVVRGMHERKRKMYDRADAFVALPGGFGTLDELCEILTWAQLNHHEKPCYLYNGQGFYTYLLSHFDHLLKEGFVSPEHRRLVRSVESVDDLFQSLEKVFD